MIRPSQRVVDILVFFAGFVIIGLIGLSGAAFIAGLWEGRVLISDSTISTLSSYLLAVVFAASQWLSHRLNQSQGEVRKREIVDEVSARIKNGLHNGDGKAIARQVKEALSQPGGQRSYDPPQGEGMRHDQAMTNPEHDRTGGGDVYVK